MVDTSKPTLSPAPLVCDPYLAPHLAGVQPYVPGEQPPPGKFIKLNTNENPYPPSPRVAQAIAEVASSAALARYPDPLATSFRLRAAERLGVDPDAILCGNGSDELLTLLTRSCVLPGQRLRLPFPSYILYRTLAQLQAAEAEEVPFRPDFSLDPAFGRCDPDLRLVFLPNPNSPSGTCLSPEAILELAEQLTCPLVVDEAYVDFAPQDCLRLVTLNPRIIILRTLSKSYALAGLRFGFLVAHPDWVRRLRGIKDSYNCDSLSIAAATAAIDDIAWFDENRSRVLATRLRMTERLRQLGFDCIDSHANFVWCTRRDRPVEPLYQGLKRQQILVRYMNYAGWGDGLRISVGTDAQVDAALTVLERLLGE